MVLRLAWLLPGRPGKVVTGVQRHNKCPGIETRPKSFSNSDTSQVPYTIHVHITILYYCVNEQIHL